MNIDDFEMPDEEEDYPITPAEEILKLTNRSQSSGECVIYSLFGLPNLCSSIAEAKDIQKAVYEVAEEITSGYIWNRDNFKLRVVEETSYKQSHYYLQGCTVYGDCIDDEWFIVYILHKISIALPNLCIRLIDRDGEFLLIEAAAEIPKWLKPENASNRVWLRDGQVNLLDNDNTDDVSCENSLSFSSAHQMLGTATDSSRFANEKVSDKIRQRISIFPMQHIAGRHTADIIVPRRCAAVLSGCPHLVSTAVNALCEADEIDKKAIDHMAAVGASDFVSATAVFTRIQYAQLMFQNFEPPALLRLADKRLDIKDANTRKALDVGLRLSSGVEVMIQKAKRLRSDIKHWSQVHATVEVSQENLVEEDNLTEHLKFVDCRCYAGVEESVHAALLHGKEAVDMLPTLAPRGKISGGGRGETDSWLYMTPDAMDKEMSERVSAMQGKSGAEKSADFNSQATTAPPTAGKQGAGTEPLTGVVQGLESFIAGESGLDGVDVEGGSDNEYFSDESENNSSASSDEEEDGLEDGCPADDDGDIALDMDKLVDILEKYQEKSSVPASEGKKKKKGKKPKRSKSKKVAGTSKEHDFSQDENHAPIVSGTATHTLDTHMNIAEGNCVVEDASDSDDNQSESSVDSDDADSDDDVGDSCDNGSDESVSDEEFYKEYQHAMDGELSGTTLQESFLHQDGEATNAKSALVNPKADSAQLEGTKAVDEELNLLTNLLESHASQLGTTGPVGNLLNVMGIQMPTVKLTDDENAP